MQKSKNILFLILIAYAFSMGFHLYWISWADKMPEFFWHGQLMINNPDGYYFASGAQKILYGMHMDNPRLLGEWNFGITVISAYLTKFFPFLSLDTVILYLSAVVSSLVVIPIILISKLYEKIEWGFIAALIASIGWSYYNRTLVGYYDTDMFSAMMPMFILYFLLGSIKNNSLNYALFASLTISIYPWLYGQGLSIIYAIGLLTFLYLVVFKLKEEFSYKFIIILLIGLFPLYFIVKLILLIVVYYLFLNNKIKLNLKNLQIISSIFLVLFLVDSHILNIVLTKISSYSTKTTMADGLHFLNVNRTVSEASHIPWYIVFDRIIGSTIGLVIAVIGYILLLKKYKEFIIALPLWGIGFFAFIGGLRFTVYAVPIAAISAVYFFIWISSKIKDNKLGYNLLLVGSVFVLLPNITHIMGCCQNNSFLSSIRKIYPLSSYPYLVSTTLKKSEVEVLNQLKHKSHDKDYVITWWDYGYPIWYYSNVNTLIDGGKHNEDNFIVSKILTTSSPELAYNLSKVSIKKYVDTNKTVALQLFMKNKKPIDVSDYLAKLSSNSFKAPKLKRDIYLMFPYRMFNIFPTVEIFSNRDINTGNVYQNHFFYKNAFRKEGKYLVVGRIPIDLSKAILKLGNNIVPIKEFDMVSYNRNGKLIVRKNRIRNEGLNVVVLKNYDQAFIIDDKYYNSMFFQMFVFQNYDKKLFKPVVLNPLMKIYKLK